MAKDDFTIPPNIDLPATMANIAKFMPDLKFFSVGTAEQNSLINKFGVKKGPRGPGNKARGGPVKKKMMGGPVNKKKMAYGGKAMKTYAMGGGMRKARTYG